MKLQLAEPLLRPDVRQAMTTFLRLLTVAAGLVIVAGGTVYLARAGQEPTAFQRFLGEPENLRSLSLIVSGAFHLHPLAMVQFGILLLIGTPVVRVLFVGIGFAMERDWLYVAVAGIVLAVLFASLTKH